MTNHWRIFGLLIALGALGCSPDIQDGVGPRVPVPNVIGLSLRAGQPADNLQIELRDAETAATADLTVSQGGQFAFAGVAGGTWEIRVAGAVAGDFDTVTRTFAVDAPDSLQELPAFEIWAFGCAASAPAAGARLPRPSLFAPLTFRWTAPSGMSQELDWMRVIVYADGGEQVWSSEKVDATELTWNGLGNEGDYTGLPVPAGAYYWRLKLAFADELEARLAPQPLEFE